MAALDVVVAWALRIVFAQVSPELSRLAAWFRLAYAAVLAMAVTNLAVVAQLVGGPDVPMMATTGQGQSQVMVLLDTFRYGWLVGLALFGIHLLVVGRLTLASGSMPRVLGVLLVLAGLAYLTDTLANLVLSDYDAYADAFTLIVALPSVVGEFWLAGWLLLRGGRLEKASPDAEVRERAGVR